MPKKCHILFEWPLTCLKALTGDPPFVEVPQPIMVGSDEIPLKSNPIY